MMSEATSARGMSVDQRPVLPIIASQLESPLLLQAETRAATCGSEASSVRTTDHRHEVSRQSSRMRSLGSSTPLPFTPPSPRRLTRTPSQDKLITKLRYKEVLDWIGTLPLPHAKKLKGPVMPEALLDGKLLWDIALHVLRPDLPNNRDEIEEHERVVRQPHASHAARCKALRDLGQSYQRMHLYGSALEMHSIQLHFASAEANVSEEGMDQVQQAMRDIGDVFRTLGEMELAQDMNKSIIATTSAQVKRGAHRERMTTPGDIQAWPTTPLTSGSRQRNVDNSPIDGVNKQVKTVKSERVRKSKNVPGQDDEHVKNSASAASMQRFGYDIHEWMTGTDDFAITEAQRIIDVFHLLQEVCGLHVEQVWPYRKRKEIRRGAMKLLASPDAKMASKAESSTLEDQYYSSDDDINIRDFLARPGSGVLDAFDTRNTEKMVLSGDEAMWLAWYLCWAHKGCQMPPPNTRSQRQHVNIASPVLEENPDPKLRAEEQTVDFESRFGHLRVDVNLPPNEILDTDKAHWHHSALSFVGIATDKPLKRSAASSPVPAAEGDDHNSSGHMHSPSSLRTASVHSPSSLRTASSFAGELIKDSDRAAKEKEWVQMPSNSPSPIRSIRPKSRQLPPAKWEGAALGIASSDTFRSTTTGDKKVHMNVLKQNAEIVIPKHDPLPRTGGDMHESRRSRRKISTEPQPSFSLPANDDGLPDKVMISDAFSWQKLDGVIVSSLSTCGSFGIITLVAGSRIGIFTTTPFQRIAEIFRKEATFSCAEGVVEKSFVRSVSNKNDFSCTSLRVDVPETKNAPSESDNFVVAGENSGHLFIASALTGLTTQVLVKENEQLGGVVSLKWLDQGSSKRLYCAHRRGTHTLWLMDEEPSILWRAKACDIGVSLSSAQALRSWAITCDENESCLRVWDFNIQPRQRNSQESVLSHEILHQNSRITCFAGYQELIQSGNPPPMIMSGANDGTVRVWCSTFGPMDQDGPTLLFGHTKAILSLFASSRTRICSGEKCIALLVQFLFVPGSADKTCRVWNPQTTKCVLNLSEHGAAVTNVWCDEYQIISATADGRLRVWSYTGTCICILESDDYETLQEPQPMTMLVFQKPLAIAIHDSEGGITIFSRDTESESISPERRRSTQDWAPNKSARSPSRKTISRNMLTVHSRGKTSNPRASTQSPTTDERSSTSFTVINDLAQPFDGEALSTSNPVSNFTLHPNRRMWWGSREDRNIQLWPTGRPWESIAKTQKERPPGVRSRQVTPSTAQSSRRQRAKSVQERTPDLGRLTSPSPFSPPRMLPEVQGSSRNYPIWMGRGAFIPEIEPQHYPGLPRRAGAQEISLEASRRALVQENMQELQGQLQVLKRGSCDYLLAVEQLRFFQTRYDEKQARAP